MTVAQYLTPSKTSLENVGIAPTTVMPDTESNNPILLTNYVTDSTLQKAIDHALRLTQ